VPTRVHIDRADDRLAIIGILAAVALPAYQSYTIRAKMSEVILAATRCRTVSTETFTSANALPGATAASRSPSRTSAAR